MSGSSTPFQFILQSTVIEYLPRAALLADVERLARNAGDERIGGEELFFGGRPDPDVVLLQSGSQSTHAVVRQDSAALNTNYYGSYANPTAWSERSQYTNRKLKALLELVSAAGARLTFLGITTVARLPTRELERDRRKHLRHAAARAFGATPRLTEDQDCFDFSLRASRTIGANVFSNVHVNWYQTRSAAVPVIATQGAPPIATSIKLWQMMLEDEGVELRFDRNNKLGLYNGVLEWSVAQFLEIANDMGNDLPGSYARLVTPLDEELAKEST